MNKINTLKTLLLTTVIILFSNEIFAQNGNITVNEDDKLTKVIEIKKDLNKENTDFNKYKIQIFSGSLAAAEKEKSKFINSYEKWSSELVYETPNYKVWIGRFRSRLEADRALIEIQKKFPSAFIFKPKKDKD
ncbi:MULTISPECIES: SPOR domain-containing protein [Mesoflavibacter]|jgi:hypothetical protein|uniref:SPOR domain-containing protein n=1 Tax=Mesoflavibacter TaxID=444051 RepID=UPI0026F04092|nr:SPOR domain-containing protein [Mesoflavibacter zeaxanthinifaciens]